MTFCIFLNKKYCSYFCYSVIKRNQKLKKSQLKGILYSYHFWKKGDHFAHLGNILKFVVPCMYVHRHTSFVNSCEKSKKSQLKGIVYTSGKNGIILPT